ncbi:hypothetical protein H6G33_09905 [Calothrix sp. FACHB-1219]|uniref:hypothetical protein n=1 Tax=unclassified Calothrix TaxID=2619626 RepID=UPI001686E5C2|nr:MULTISPECIES: hypothetical protein [unclassified Calothrix]MBD2201660.1 hypothetical protein [Calothrix sp. FACHB-168]MBD2217346.1 hypothetical protein [Calothrix sp. FACHB-1219]
MESNFLIEGKYYLYKRKKEVKYIKESYLNNIRGKASYIFKGSRGGEIKLSNESVREHIQEME